MTAGSGEGGGRHARRDVPEDLGPGESTPAAGTSGSSTSGPSPDAIPTQALPVFRREASGETARVRAVAPRVASALPAIGGDEIRDAPASARATIERRRRARGEDGTTEAGTTASGAAAGSDQAGGTRAAGAATGVEAGPADAAGARAAEAADGFAADDGPDLADVELVPIGGKGRPRRVPGALLSAGGGTAETPPPAEPAQSPAAQVEPDPQLPAAQVEPDPQSPAEPVEPAQTPAEQVEVPEQRAPLPPVPPEVATPVLNSPKPALVPAVREPGSPPVAPRHAAAGPPDVVDAEVVDDPTGEHRAVIDATAAEMVSALTHVAFRDARTDEWAVVPTDPAGVPALDEPGVELAPVPRSGPVVLESDSWETSSLPVIPADSYQGRRRKASSGSLARWLVVIGVVLALSAAVAIPFLITSGGGSQTPEAEGPPSSEPAVPVVVSSPTPEPTEEPYMPIGEASPTPPPTPSRTAVSPSASAAAFTLTLQAESGSLSGCAQAVNVAGASGGRVVDRLGGGWSGCMGRGVVTFNNVSLQSGTYRVTIYYVFNQSNGDATRNARLRVDRNGPGADGPTIDHTYANTKTCCQSWTTSTFTITTGTFAISFTSPGPQQNRAPALDRIVIQKV